MRQIFVLLVCFLFSAARITQIDAIKEPRVRHLFVQRRSPLPGTPRKVFTVEHEALDDSEASDNPADQDVHKVFSRVRRSLNPDLRPRVNEVGPNVIV